MDNWLSLTGNQTPPQVPLNVDYEFREMMLEQKVLSMKQGNKRRYTKCQCEVTVNAAMPTTEFTRFSSSQDQESMDLSRTGNTRKIQESLSETASSHSVSSVDDGDHDNLLDVTSTNVSGRGSTNISGSDTASSQARSIKEAHSSQLPIKETDILDIDSELDRNSEPPPESNRCDRLEELAHSNSCPQQDHVSETSETASDAWITDVVAKDTEDKEPLSKVHKDDVSSVLDLTFLTSGDAGNLENTDGRHSVSDDLQVEQGLETGGCTEPVPPTLLGMVKVNQQPEKPFNHNVYLEADSFYLGDLNGMTLPPPKPDPLQHSARVKSSNLVVMPEYSLSQEIGALDCTRTLKPLFQLKLDRDKLSYPRSSVHIPSPHLADEGLSLNSQLRRNNHVRQILHSYPLLGFHPPNITTEQFQATCTNQTTESPGSCCCYHSV